MTDSAIIIALIVVLGVVVIADVAFARDLEMEKFEAIDNLVGIIVSGVLVVVANKLGNENRK